MNSLFDQPPKPVPPAPVVPPPRVLTPEELPPFLEYQPPGVAGLWRVDRWPELVVRLRLEVSSAESAAVLMGRVHGALAPAASWLLVRRLFGVGPLLPGPETPVEDLQAWDRSRIGEVMGLTPEAVEANVDAAAVLWKGWRERNLPAIGSVADEAPAPAAVTGEAPQPFDAARVLAEFGFPEKMFEMQWTTTGADGKTTLTERRTREAAAAERDWFARRCEDLRKQLSETRSGAASLARNLLHNELYLRRLDDDMTRCPTSSPQWQRHHQVKLDLEARVAEQHAALSEMFPDLSAASKVSFRQSLGDIVKAYQDYYAHADNRLLGHMATVAELDFQTRQSTLLPQPRLRLGLQVHLLDAIQGLWDPQWRPSFSHRALKRLDAAGRAAIEASRLEDGEQLVDLEKPEEEFPDLPHTPPPVATEKTL